MKTPYSLGPSDLANKIPIISVKALLNPIAKKENIDLFNILKSDIL
tara:strand:+ start:625 stop:762 length:138 start_codon:yes stop_codon:yes gene_type:complete